MPTLHESFILSSQHGNSAEAFENAGASCDGAMDRMMVGHMITFWCTLPETNIAPETLGLEDSFPFGMANSHHQDYSIFSRESEPKPAFVTVTGWGVDLMYTIYLVKLERPHSTSPQKVAEEGKSPYFWEI